jgi:phosphoglycolate phosphatase
MIGDSEADTMAAQSAGIGCICVTFGYALTPVETLGADALIDDYTGFIDTVGKLRPLMGYALENIQTH